MPVRASIEPLTWENAFFGVNSAIVRITSEAPLLMPDALAPVSYTHLNWSPNKLKRLAALPKSSTPLRWMMGSLWATGACFIRCHLAN